MKSFASRYNRRKVFDVNTEGFEYKSLADLYNENGSDHVYPLCAVYINRKSKYGDSVVAATDTFFVNWPAHMVSTVEDILSDEEAIEAINRGNVGFCIHTYHQTRYNRDCFGINFVDINYTM